MYDPCETEEQKKDAMEYWLTTIEENKKPSSLLFVIANNKLTKEQNQIHTSTFESDKQLYSHVDVANSFECVGISYNNEAITSLTVSVFINACVIGLFPQNRR